MEFKMKKRTKTKGYVNKLNEISQTLQELIGELLRDVQESEQRYRSIVEFAEDAIITIGPDNKVQSWNQGACKIFRWQNREVLGKDLDSLITRGEVEAEASELSKTILQGKSLRSFEAVRYTKNGEPRQVLISAAPIENINGQVEAASIMYKDISELKQAHAQLVQTEKQATLGIIAGSIGHELNNLVGGLLLHARLLQHYADKPDKVRETAEILLSHLEKVTLHGKNLLSLSRPTKPRFEELDLNVILQDTTSTLVLSGVLKHFDINAQFESKKFLVKGDRHQLEQVIRNLEINAAHAMGSKGILTLQTRLRRDGKQVEVIIGDSGAGIPNEIRDKIFQPFYTTKAEGQGTGLGLTIVKDIIEKHRGTLKLESKVGVGTKVIIGLPVV